MRFRQVVFVLGVVFSFAVGATAQEEALSDTLKAIAFSPDGKLLVGGSSNKTVSLWDYGPLFGVIRLVFASVKVRRSKWIM